MLGLTASALLVGFNPRAHAGRDKHEVPIATARRWFQPTRPRGARLADVAADLGISVVSTHAPTRGAT